MTHDEKIVEAVARAICAEVNQVRFDDLPEAATYLERKTHVDRAVLDKGEAREFARAAITAYQAEAWQDSRADAVSRIAAMGVQPERSETFHYQADGYASGWHAAIAAYRQGIRKLASLALPNPPASP